MLRRPRCFDVRELVVLEWLKKDPAVQQGGEIVRMRSMALVWSHKLTISQEHSSLLIKKSWSCWWKMRAETAFSSYSSLSRVQGSTLSLSNLLPQLARLSLLEDSAGPLVVATGFDRCFTGRLAFDGRLRSSPFTYRRFVGDLYSRGLL